MWTLRLGTISSIQLRGLSPILRDQVRLYLLHLLKTFSKSFGPQHESLTKELARMVEK